MKMILLIIHSLCYNIFDDGIIQQIQVESKPSIDIVLEYYY
jgi:hypothetical protein